MSCLLVELDVFFVVIMGCPEDHPVSVLVLHLEAHTPHRASSPTLIPKLEKEMNSSRGQCPQFSRQLSDHKMGSVSSNPLKQACHCCESMQYEDKSKADCTDLQKVWLRVKSVSSQNLFPHGAKISSLSIHCPTQCRAPQGSFSDSSRTAQVRCDHSMHTTVLCGA